MSQELQEQLLKHIETIIARIKALEDVEPIPKVQVLRTSPETDKIYAALAIAQGMMKAPPKNKHVDMSLKDGRRVKYDYADLADCLEAIRVPFRENGLSLIQPPCNSVAGVVIVLTRIAHSSGQYIECDIGLPVGDDKPQTLGSAITYGRRYGLCAMAGIAPDADDDGQLAQDAAGEAESKKRKPREEAPRKPEQEPMQHRKPPVEEVGDLDEKFANKPWQRQYLWNRFVKPSGATPEEAKQFIEALTREGGSLNFAAEQFPLWNEGRLKRRAEIKAASEEAASRTTGASNGNG